eukprot:6199995-Pleurochrysis_carterae.AAC.5
MAAAGAGDPRPTISSTAASASAYRRRRATGSPAPVDNTDVLLKRLFNARAGDGTLAPELELWGMHPGSARRRRQNSCFLRNSLTPYSFMMRRLGGYL